jgi:hypothetical protein
MHLTDHISDVQLNEYLDNEIEDRTQVELHLSSCEDCAARLSALQALFDEIESLPEVALTRSLATSVTRKVSGRASLPRSLRLVTTLQAVMAIFAIIFAAPFVVQWSSPYVSNLPMPSIADVILEMQTQWRIWLGVFSQFQFPTPPEIPIIDLSSLAVMLTVAGISLLWLIGNRFLLRNQMK